jgi:hypothetical protein
VIITSGYNEQEIAPLFAGKCLSGFIQKPFSFPALQKALVTVPVSNCPQTLLIAAKILN